MTIMPTDRATKTVEIKAPFADVLATIRDLESQVEWIPEIKEAEVLEVYEDNDLPATARFKADAKVATDVCTLAYEHQDDGMSWTLVEGKIQTEQDGRFTLKELAPDKTSVTYELTIGHNMPLPGFVRSRVIKGLVDGTLNGLKKRLET
jgi:uncharacterized membrane protein